MTSSPEPKSRSAWFWIPSLYFSQGIPYVIVMTMSVVMYKRLGISNTDIALYTSWLYLPWVVKPLWSPWVDALQTKRRWIVVMQFLVSFALLLAAFSVRADDFFRWSLCLFWVMAFASATHDIAADGFYMLSLDAHGQAWWVGLRSTFYRTAMVVGSGLLVVFAGVMESRNGPAPASITVTATANPAPAATLAPADQIFGLEPGELRLRARPTALEIPEGATTNKNETLIESAVQWNVAHGFVPPPPISAESEATKKGGPLHAAWQSKVARPLEHFLAAHFPRAKSAPSAEAGNVGVVYLALTRPPASGQSVAVNLQPCKSGLQWFGLGGGKTFSVREGERLIFNETNWNQSAVAIIQVDPQLSGEAKAVFQITSGNVPVAWSVTLLLVAGLFMAFSFWHAIMLPRPPADGPVRQPGRWSGEFSATLGAFFKKPHIGSALAFILLYRFDEAQLSKVISPFLLDGREAGGLGLSTSQVGLAYGTFGILALVIGGLVGGFWAARWGLKRVLPFMVAAMYLPKAVFLLLAWLQPANLAAIFAAVAVEQFGYGLGFTAFMLYLLYFAAGPHRTAHYALCTGFMALGMMIPGLWSGWLADIVGYQHFFVWVLISTVPGLVLALNLRIDPEFGKKHPL